MAKSYNNSSNKEEKELTEEEKDLLSGKGNPLLVILEKEGESDNTEEEKEENKSDEEKTEETNKNEAKQEKQSENDYQKTIAKYNSEFSSLQSDFESKLSGLISEGYSEFQSGASPGKLAPKYLGKGAELESQCDAEFYNMLDSLKTDLNNKGEDTSLIKDLENYYNSYKDAKRGELMNKVRDRM